MMQQADMMEEFHSWQCVSLISCLGQTLDLVVPDEGHMMALLNVLGRFIFQATDS